MSARVWQVTPSGYTYPLHAYTSMVRYGRINGLGAAAPAKFTWKTALALGVAGVILWWWIDSAPSVPEKPTNVRTVYYDDGEPLKVGMRGGEMYFYYDHEWFPLADYGGPGVEARIIGDKIVVTR